MTFSSGLDLKKHLDLAHRGRDERLEFQCLVCAREFGDKSELREHLQEHEREKPYKCEFGDKGKKTRDGRWTGRVAEGAF